MLLFKDTFHSEQVRPYMETDGSMTVDELEIISKEAAVAYYKIRAATEKKKH
jgi:hypothetical protein